jgi:hypothetical protein
MYFCHMLTDCSGTDVRRFVEPRLTDSPHLNLEILMNEDTSARRSVSPL